MAQRSATLQQPVVTWGYLLHIPSVLKFTYKAIHALHQNAEHLLVRITNYGWYSLKAQS